ncbi:hypothetical protein [Nibricoccus aquaticus]|uniref:hypothetical protein n=1 Tax=Nibricoccus aquaticus TaxID=2576891 RepID=UPI0010FE519D|nr:hypothetical protein [Nibricoccus aquaticus]
MIPQTNSRLGIAETTDDLHRVVAVCRAAEINLHPEDGNSGIGYAFTVSTNEWANAQRLITASHRFRSGDLRVFLFDHPIPQDMPLRKEVWNEYSSWRVSLRHKDRPAPDPDFDAFVEERIAAQSKRKR